MRWRVQWPWLAVSALLASCAFDAGVPSSTAVRCDDGRCPQGFACRPALGLCVALAPDDTGQAPGLTAGAVAPARARSGTSLRISLTASEPLYAPPRVSLLTATGARAATLESQAGQDYVFTYGLQAGVDAEGPTRVVADLVDAQGTEALGQAVGVVDVDFTPPTVVSASFTAPRPGEPSGLLAVRGGELVTLQVSLSEPVQDGARLTAAPDCAGALSFSSRSPPGAALSFAATAPPRDCAPASLAVSDLVDLAGNRAAPVALAPSLAVDGQAPVLSNVRLLRGADGGTAAAAGFSRQPGFDRYVLAFDVDPTNSTVAARLDLEPLGTCACQAGACACLGTVGAASVEGLHTLFVTATDPAGNTATDSVQTRFDFTGPAVLESDFSAPRPSDGGLLEVRAGEPLAVRVTTSEPTSGLERLSTTSACDAGVSFSLRSSQGTVLDFASPGAGPGDCAYGLTLAGLEDLVGNTTPPGPLAPRLTVDGTPPRIVDLAVLRSTDGGLVAASSFSRQPGFDAFVARLTLDGSPDTFAARLDNRPLTGCTCAGLTCDCPYTVQASDTEGSHAVSMTVADRAGNVAAGSTSIVFDFSAPGLAAGSVDVALTPPAGCPRPAISRLGVGARLDVRFAVDEPLGAEPGLLGPVALQAASSGSLAYAFSGTVPPGADGGARALEVRLVDRAGNAALVPLQRTVEVDVAAPQAPATLRDGGVLYLRRPWGAQTPVPAFTLLLGEAAVEPGALVRAFDGPSPPTSLLLGSGVADADGGLTLGLALLDRAVVYVDATDEACNSSAAVDVKDVEWLATFGRKQPGSTLANPHRAARRPELRVARVQADEAEVSSYGALGADDGQLYTLLGGRTFQRRNAGDDLTTVQRLDEGALVYHRALEELMALDPLPQGMAFWRYDGVSWHVSPAAGVPALNRYKVGYDVGRQRLVLYGNVSTALAIWEWDGERWEDRTPPGGLLAGVLLSATAAYDSARGKLVIVDQSGSKVWEWDGRALTEQAITNPPVDYGMVAASDGQDRLHAYGQDGTLSRLDGNSWTPVRTGGPTLNSPALAFDRGRGLWVLMGRVTSPTASRLTYEWGAGAPTLRQTESAALGEFVSVAYDERRAEVWRLGRMFSGPSATVCGRWASPAWVNRVPRPAFPTLNETIVAAYDSVRGVTVAVNAGATHEWDGRAWRVGLGSVPTWPTNDAPGITFDPATGRTLLFASGASTLYSWSGAGWTTITPSVGSVPAPRVNPGLVYDSVRGRVLLFGGGSPLPATPAFRDLWSWSFNTFTLLSPTGTPPPGHSFSMAFDSNRGQVVVYDRGAGLLLGDGSSWQAVTASPNPGSRFKQAMAHDSAEGTTLLMGGENSSGAPANVWGWNGTAWADVTPLGLKPAATNYLALVYDSARRRTVALGGVSNSEPHWELGFDERFRPGLVCTFELRAAELEAGARIERLAVEARAGGEGGAGRNTAGAALQVFGSGAWVTRATNGATSSAPGALAWEETRATALSELVAAPLELTLAPVGNNDAVPARLAVDAVAVRLRYRRP